MAFNFRPKSNAVPGAWLYLLLPLFVLVALHWQPQWDAHLQSNWFHFQVVSFTSLVAFVLGMLITILTGSVADLRTFFVTLALVAISGIFLVHGVATPDVLIPMPHSTTVVAQPVPDADDDGYGPSEASDVIAPTTAPPSGIVLRPDLAVTWSAPISLLAGAFFFALAALRWSAKAQRFILSHRREFWYSAVLIYGAYVVTAFAIPFPLLKLSELSPVSIYVIAALIFLLYAGAAFYFWRAYARNHHRYEAGLALALGLLAEAIIPMTLAPAWSVSWWIYHLLMLAAFSVALRAVVLEYEHVLHFQLTPYFTASGVIVVALLTLVSGELATRVLGGVVPPDQMNLLRWGTGGLFAILSALLLLVLLQIVRRGDQLLSERAGALQKQQAELERGRMAQALVPIGLAIESSLDLAQVLDVICQESLKLFDVDSALLWIKEGDELFGKAARGYKHNEFLGMRQKVTGNNLLGARVVSERKPLLVNHAQDKIGVSAALVDLFNIHSIMGVPLLHEDEPVGALILIDCRNDERFRSLDIEVGKIFGQQAALAVAHARLYEKIRQHTDTLALTLNDLSDSYLATMTALSGALDARDRETEGHSRRVVAYSLKLIETLSLVDPATRESLEWGALLHDVGKIGVPDAILHKPGRLTEAEWQVMRRHPEIGQQILHPIPFLHKALPVVLFHHERWDGQGYPFRLSREAIPLPARIFMLADTLDAITSTRPYRAARSFSEARAEMLRCRGTQFDPMIVDAFASIPTALWQAVREQVSSEKFATTELLTSPVLLAA